MALHFIPAQRALLSACSRSRLSCLPSHMSQQLQKYKFRPNIHYQEKDSRQRKGIEGKSSASFRETEAVHWWDRSRHCAGVAEGSEGVRHENWLFFKKSLPCVLGGFSQVRSCAMDSLSLATSCRWVPGKFLSCDKCDPVRTLFRRKERNWVSNAFCGRRARVSRVPTSVSSTVGPSLYTSSPTRTSTTLCNN